MAVRNGAVIRSIPFKGKARQEFGRHLHAAMCARSMTSKQLALAAGVADPTLKTLAAGNVNNSVERLSMYVIVGIADGLGIDPNEVIRWTGNGDVVAQSHIEAARRTARMRSARYRAQAESDMKKTVAEDESLASAIAKMLSGATAEAPAPAKTATLAVEVVKPAPEVSVTAVMLKLRKLAPEDLVLVDELVSELVQ